MHDHITAVSSKDLPQRTDVHHDIDYIIGAPCLTARWLSGNAVGREKVALM